MKRRFRFLYSCALFSFSSLCYPAPVFSSIWYVNDTSTTGDSFTFAHGYDTQGGGSTDPLRNITRAMQLVKSGDTIFIDPGIYDSAVNVDNSGTAVVRIDTDQIWLIGADSRTVIIDPPGAKTISGLYGIYADTQIELTIKNIGVTGAYYGIYFNNVDISTISGDSVSTCGAGMAIGAGSDSNIISGNTASSNTDGISLDLSSNNIVSNNEAGSNGKGITLSSCSNNTVSNNVVSLNSFGIRIGANADNNTVNNNMVSSNDYGIFLVYCSNNTVSNNVVSSNTNYGIWLQLNSNNSTVSNNTVCANDHGIFLQFSPNATVIQNDLCANTRYQIYIDNTDNDPSSDTVLKNNVKSSAAYPDSGVYNGSNARTPRFIFKRNWWGTTDSAAVRKMMGQTSNSDSIVWHPFRLGEVDTTAGADTVAPKAPSNISIAKNSSGQAVLTWTNPTVDEENAVLTGFGGVRIYRIVNIADTTDWAVGRVAQVAAPATTWTDTNVSTGNNYYYRLTSFDSWPIVNESWFSDSILTTDTGNDAFAFVRRGAGNPPPQSVFGFVSDMPVLQIVVGPRSNGIISSLKVTIGGTGNDLTALSASGVKLWQDGDGNGTGDTQIGSSGTVSSNDGEITFSGLSVNLTKDKPLYLVVTYTFAGTASAGQTFYAQIAAATDITATASGGAFTLVGLPITGEPVTAVSSGNNNPSAPTPSSPANNATGIAPNGEVSLGAFSDADGDTHKCTHWQVADSTATFDNMHMRVNVIIPAETAGLRFKFPRGLLRSAQKHYWRARFCDARGGWSSWGTTRAFTTTADSLAFSPVQARTMDSNPFASDTRPIGFNLKNGGNEKFTTLGGVKYEDEVSDTGRNEKPSTNFKFGLIAFTCEGVDIGGTITIALNMPESVPVTAKYFIFDAANGWLDMTANLTSHDGDSEVLLTLTDGATGDLDGIANGVIVDPGGFEIASSGSGSGSGDGAIQFPSACLITKFLGSQYCASVRWLRDQILQTASGRKIVGLYYHL